MKIVALVRTAVNGDEDRIEPAVRRTLYAMAGELDEQAQIADKRLNDLALNIEHAISDVRDEVRGVKRLLVTLTSAVIAGIIVGIANILMSL